VVDSQVKVVERQVKVVESQVKVVDSQVKVVDRVQKGSLCLIVPYHLEVKNSLPANY